jgi:DNA-binding transcriptional ArsR family regulator
MRPDDFQTLVQFLKALADESRLKLLGLLAGQERSVKELAKQLGLKEPTVSHHLSRLQELDLVSMRAEGTTHRYRLRAETLHRLSRELFTPTQVASIADTVEGETWERKVLRTYFDGDTLTRIPATRKKRDVVLRWLVNRFEPGTRYPEAEVNEILKRYHPDSATLRREFIMTKMMERKKGVYWRTGESSEEESA